MVNSYYPDSLANVSIQPQKRIDINILGQNLINANPYQGILTKECPSFFVPGSCDNGHRLAKEIYCGREWCAVCGQDWSNVHQRRFARWLHKCMQIKSMGYWIFTIPDELREQYKTKKELKELGHKIQEMLKSQGYARGLRRWHFFGETCKYSIKGFCRMTHQKCPKKKCDKFVNNGKYNSHLNVIVDSEYLNPEQIQTVKMAYSVLLGIDLADTNLYYEYADGPAQKVHIMKYVTRATFLDYRWDVKLALELRGFRNQVTWGRGQWNDIAAWSLDELGSNVMNPDQDVVKIEAIAQIETGKCHICGMPITWGGVLPIGVLNQEKDRVHLGAGYWQLKGVSPPPAGRMLFKRLDMIERWRRIGRKYGIELLLDYQN